MIGILRRHPLHLLCELLAVVAFGGEVYVLSQARVPADQITVIPSSDGTASCNEAATLRSYLFWLALGVITAVTLNIIMTLAAIAKSGDWRVNFTKKSLWKLVLLPVLVSYYGLATGILPMLLTKSDALGTAAFIILTLYFQTLVWALVLAWRDVRNPNYR